MFYTALKYIRHKISDTNMILKYFEIFDILFNCKYSFTPLN